MYPKQRTIADTRWEEALNEVRAAAPGLRAVVHCADAVGAKTDEEWGQRPTKRGRVAGSSALAFER
jgi:hypothetical protein